MEGVITQLMNSVSFYAFRLGKKLIFAGPYPAYPEEPQPSPLDLRRGSAPASIVGADSPVGGRMTTESPVDRTKAAVKLMFSKGTRMGWNSKSDMSAGDSLEDGRWNGWDAGGGRSTAGSTPTASVTTASVSDFSGGRSFYGGGGNVSRRRRSTPAEGSRIERAVAEALDRSVIPTIHYCDFFFPAYLYSTAVARNLSLA